MTSFGHAGWVAHAQHQRAAGDCKHEIEDQEVENIKNHLEKHEHEEAKRLKDGKDSSASNPEKTQRDSVPKLPTSVWRAHTWQLFLHVHAVLALVTSQMTHKADEE